MALGLNQLINNIQGSFNALGNRFKRSEFKGGNYPQPTLSQVLSTIDPANWAKNASYSFKVVENDSSLKSGSGFSEFVLPINPSEISQDENFAITIRPTQGGTIVDHGGNKYKDLVISGTTGVHPNKGAGGASRITGQANFQPNELQNASGFEVFLELRNYFKAYYQFKKENQTTDARETRLVFNNYKDGEFLLIEVPKFSMKRSAAKPFMYDYTITARVLGVLKTGETGLTNDFQKDDGFDSILNEALNQIDNARGIFLRTSDILRQVESTFDLVVLEPSRRAALALKAYLGVGFDLADLGPRIIRRTLNTKDTIQILLTIRNRQNTERNTGQLDPRLEQVQLPTNIQAYASQVGPEAILRLPGDSPKAIETGILPLKSQEALDVEKEEALELPREFFEDLRNTIERIERNAQDAFNFNDAGFDSIFDRTSSSSVDINKTATDEEIEALAGLNKAIQGLNLILSNTALFKSSYTERIENVNNAFLQSPGLLAERAVKEITMPTGVSLERLSLEQLGTASRWQEIVELNQLKAPYVTQDLSDTREALVKPGDKILIPQPVIFGFGSTPTNRETFINESLTEVERNLGIDLKLNEFNDLDFTNKNDINLVTGAENAAQAILMKLAIEKGEILDHPGLGVGLQIGQKTPVITEVQSDIINTLTQDSRFEEVRDLSIRQNGGTFEVRLLVKIKNIDIPIPLNIQI